MAESSAYGSLDLLVQPVVTHYDRYALHEQAEPRRELCPMFQRVFGALRRRVQAVVGHDNEPRSLLLLQDLLREYGFLPVSGSAMSFESILTICNDILINERKAVIEFGSGISTLAIASLIRRKGLTCRFVSVDGNAAWQEIISRCLHDAGTEEGVELIHAPVAHHRLALAGNTWYDLDSHRDSIAASKFDSVIVDGPEACNDRIALARYPALPFLRDHLDFERCFVLLDDAERSGEREVRRRWKAELGIDLLMKVSKSACGFRGKCFNPIP